MTLFLSTFIRPCARGGFSSKPKCPLPTTAPFIYSAKMATGINFHRPFLNASCGCCCCWPVDFLGKEVLLWMMMPCTAPLLKITWLLVVDDVSRRRWIATVSREGEPGVFHARIPPSLLGSSLEEEEAPKMEAKEDVVGLGAAAMGGCRWICSPVRSPNRRLLPDLLVVIKDEGRWDAGTVSPDLDLPTMEETDSKLDRLRSHWIRDRGLATNLLGDSNWP
ncbi:hypothetical protein ACLOJK_004744 [Asimina triloba]